MLNNTQKQLLIAATEYLFEDISQCADKAVAVKALQALTQDEVFTTHRDIFQTQNILDSVEQLRQFYQHPCPQNRAIGSPYVGQEEGLAVWKDPITHQICKEPLGILGLTAQNDDTTEGVKKQDVLEYLDILVQRYQVQLQQEMIKDLQTQLEKKPTSSKKSSSKPITLDSKDKGKEKESSSEENASDEEKEEQGTSSENASASSLFASAEKNLLKNAQNHLDQRDHQSALQYLDQLVNGAPHNARYRYLRGRSLAILRRREEALQDFNLSLRADPRQAQTWVERGFTRENLQDIHGAIQDYTKALLLDPQHVFALYQRGGLLMRLGQREKGEADFLAALEIRNDDPMLYRNRGEQYLYMGLYPQAIADFDDAIRLRPQWDDVKAMRAEAQRQMANTPAQEAPAARRCSVS